MKNLKYASFVLLIVISFYLTDKIIIYMENKHPIMQEIDARKESFRVAPVNAIINDNTIIPGINGKDVNRRQSYMRMGEFGAFNETFIVFDIVRPNISIEDNRDKVIIRGNPTRRQVSLILEENPTIITLLNNQEINFTIIAGLNTDFTREQEYIPGEKSQNRMRDLHFILNRRRINSGICLLGHSNIELCYEKNYFLIAPSIDSNDNISELLTNIRSGDIILIRHNIPEAHLNLIISEIRRQDLQIVPISTLISENR